MGKNNVLILERDKTTRRYHEGVLNNAGIEVVKFDLENLIQETIKNVEQTIPSFQKKSEKYGSTLDNMVFDIIVKDVKDLISKNKVDAVVIEPLLFINRKDFMSEGDCPKIGNYEKAKEAIRIIKETGVRIVAVTECYHDKEKKVLEKAGSNVVLTKTEYGKDDLIQGVIGN